MITSAANPKLKLARAVKDGREPELLFVEGERLCEDAVISGLQVRMVLHGSQPSARAQALLERLPQVEQVAVQDALLQAVADTVKTQGLVLLAERKVTPLAEALAGSLTVVLDAVQDPGNVGALMRTAEAAGATGMVLLRGCADAFSPKVLRSAMGSAFRLPLATQVTGEELLAACAVAGLAVVSTSGVDAVVHTQFDWVQPTALVLGNEGNGVCEGLLAASQARVCIPMQGAVESLNVAAAGAVLLFEAARQRSVAKG
jgi:RNA methyltransferase, TrmH family